MLYNLKGFLLLYFITPSYLIIRANPLNTTTLPSTSANKTNNTTNITGITTSMRSIIDSPEHLLLAPIYNNRSVAYEQAMIFLDKMMNPRNCTGATYAVVEMGIGGGFAAHFQLAASDWMRALVSFNFSIPVLIIGKIKGYSTVSACDKYDQDWRCFFEDLSNCQSEVTNNAKKEYIFLYLVLSIFLVVD